MTLAVGDTEGLKRCWPPDYEFKRVLPKGTVENLLSGTFGYSNYASPGNVLISMREFNGAIRDIDAGVYDVVEVLLPIAERPQLPWKVHGCTMIDPKYWNEFRRNEVVNARDQQHRAYWHQYFSGRPIAGSS
jgi:hypothetical protein